MLFIVCRVIDCTHITLMKSNMSNFNIRKKFGKRVRFLRNLIKLSQEELGFKSDIHRTYIGAVERGEQNISLDNIYKLSKALKVSIKDLFEF